MGWRPLVNNLNAETGLGILANMKNLVVNIVVHVINRIIEGLIQKITVNPTNMTRPESILGNGVEHEFELIEHDAMGNFCVIGVRRLTPLGEKGDKLVKKEVFQRLLDDMSERTKTKEGSYCSENRGRLGFTVYDERAGN